MLRILANAGADGKWAVLYCSRMLTCLMLEDSSRLFRSFPDALPRNTVAKGVLGAWVSSKDICGFLLSQTGKLSSHFIVLVCYFTSPPWFHE